MGGIGRRKGYVKLGIISIEVKGYRRVGENRTDGRSVEREKEWTKYRALGNAGVDRRRRGKSGINNDRHKTVC